MLDIKSLLQAMIPNRKSPLYEDHPLIKLIGAFIVLIALIICRLEVALFMAIIILVESIVGKVLSNIWQFFRSLRYILPPIGIIVFLLYPLERATLILVRLIVGSIAFLNVYATTRMLDMEQALEKIKVPIYLIRTTSLAIRLIPLSIKDAEQSIEALSLRGIYKGGFRGAIPLLAVILANSLDRTEFLTEALVAKYFLMGKRKYPWKLKITMLGIIFLALKISCLILALVGPKLFF